MDENQYRVTIWKIVAAAFSVLVVTIGACNVNQHYKIAELVAGGADPIKAQCAIYGVSSGNAAVCGAETVK